MQNPYGPIIVLMKGLQDSVSVVVRHIPESKTQDSKLFGQLQKLHFSSNFKNTKYIDTFHLINIQRNRSLFLL